MKTQTTRSNTRSLPSQPGLGVAKKPHPLRRLVIIVVLAVALALIVKVQSEPPRVSEETSGSFQSQALAKKEICTSNKQSHAVMVSISQRHMWACSGSKEVYDSPVVTGMEMYDADRTPVGTYTVYSKQRDQVLTGADSTGSWSDPVSYWMPFLSNKYGIYGFHDATWRKDGDFGTIDPYSDNASHGCVELPIATAKWLYNWAPVGTTVTIKS